MTDTHPHDELSAINSLFAAFEQRGRGMDHGTTAEALAGALRGFMMLDENLLSSSLARTDRLPCRD